MRQANLFQSAVLVALLLTAPVRADDKSYLGGVWNSSASWSPEGVPTAFDRAVFDSAHVGTVFVAGGFDVDEIIVNGDAYGYTFTGEGGTLGHALRINVDAQDTLFDFATLTGQAFNGGYAIGLNGNGTTEWRTSLVNTNSEPLDAYISGVFTRNNFNSGDTTLHSYTMLKESGSFLATAHLNVDRSMLEIENKQSDSAPGNRIGDGTRLGFNAAFVYIHNDDIATEEHIAGIDLGFGHSRISSSGADLVAPGSALVRDASKHGTLMLETALGSTRVAPSGMGIGSHVIPWATRYGNLAFYDVGDDSLPGNGDDVGFIDVNYVDFDTALTDEHGELNGPASMASARTMRSLNVRDGQTLNTGDAVLTLTDSALVIGNGSTITQNIAGRVQFSGGTESFVHVPYGSATIAARLSSGNGLVKGGGGDLTLSGANNISGPIYFNSGMLELASVNAISASNELHLVESSIKFNYGSGGTVSNHIVLNTGRSDPLYGGSYILDWIVKDNTNWNFSGLIEGHGPYFVRGENSKITISGVHASTPGVAQPNEDFSLWPQGNVNLEITGRLGDENNRGTLILFGGRATGNGEVTGGIQVTNGGTFAPGLNNGAGIALFKTHSLAMFDGRMEFQINGTARGTQYDAVDANNIAYFGGGGTVAVTGSRTGQIGDQYDLVRYPFGYSFSGGPTLTNSLNVQSGGQWVWWIDSDAFTLAVAGPTGDASLDGTVNFDDLLILAQHYGETGANWSTGDFTGDGVVNFDDLLLIAQRYGQSALINTTLTLDFQSDWALAQSVVPEPTVVAMVGMVMPLARRRRVG